jgi:hypothetical protein
VERKKGGSSTHGDSGAAATLGWRAQVASAGWIRGSKGSSMREKTWEWEASDRWATQHSVGRWTQSDFESIQMSLNDFQLFQIN